VGRRASRRGDGRVAGRGCCAPAGRRCRAGSIVSAPGRAAAARCASRGPPADRGLSHRDTAALSCWSRCACPKAGTRIVWGRDGQRAQDAIHATALRADRHRWTPGPRAASLPQSRCSGWARDARPAARNGDFSLYDVQGSTRPVSSLGGRLCRVARGAQRVWGTRSIPTSAARSAQGERCSSPLPARPTPWALPKPPGASSCPARGRTETGDAQQTPACTRDPISAMPCTSSKLVAPDLTGGFVATVRHLSAPDTRRRRLSTHDLPPCQWRPPSRGAGAQRPRSTGRMDGCPSPPAAVRIRCHPKCRVGCPGGDRRPRRRCQPRAGAQPGLRRPRAAGRAALRLPTCAQRASDRRSLGS
jgi:hypothetical protein